LHVDSPWKVHFKGRVAGSEQGPAAPGLLTRGHYAAIVYPIYIPDYLHHGHPTIADAEAIFDTIERMVAASPSLALASAGPVPADKVAVFVTIEGAGPFAADPAAVDRFIARGVRLVGLVHAHDSPLAGSATGGSGVGLSEVGRAFCRRVYRAGALVDVSHMSDAAFADVAAIAADLGAPLVASHSNARALAPSPRNLTDAQLATIGKSGGVAGLNLYRRFVKPDKPTMADLVAQVRHMVAQAGVDHVAIGSDFDGGEPVADLADASRWPALAEALRAAGMSEIDVRKIFGRNGLRMLTWRPAAAPSAE